MKQSASDEYCPDCGEVNESCVCFDYEDEDLDIDKEFKFEYAFESLTENKSKFKKNRPIS